MYNNIYFLKINLRKNVKFIIISYTFLFFKKMYIDFFFFYYNFKILSHFESYNLINVLDLCLTRSHCNGISHHITHNICNNSLPFIIDIVYSKKRNSMRYHNYFLCQIKVVILISCVIVHFQLYTLICIRTNRPTMGYHNYSLC